MNPTTAGKEFIGGATVAGILGAPTTAISMLQSRTGGVQTVPQAAENKNAASGTETGESTAVNTNPMGHTAEENRVIEEYKNAVDQALKDFVVNKDKQAYELKPVSERAANDIEALTGKKVQGFSTIFEKRQTDHIEKDHGANGKADHSMADPNDIARIQYVLDNYDSVKDGGQTDAYWEPKDNGKQRQAKTVVFEKKIDGTYYVIEAAPVTKAKSVYVVSAYISKGKKTEGNVKLPDAVAPWFTPESDSSTMPSGNSISRVSENSNTQNENTVIGLPHPDDIASGKFQYPKPTSGEPVQRVPPLAIPEGLRAEVSGKALGVGDEVIEFAKRMEYRFGHPVVFVSETAKNGLLRNGFYDSSTGVIYVNTNSGNPVEQIFAHELTHSLEASKSYQTFSELIYRQMAKIGVDIAAMEQEVRQRFTDVGRKMDDAAIRHEVIAEYVEKHLLTDEAAIQSIVRQNRTFGQWVHDAIDTILAKLGNKDAAERAFLQNAKRLYAKALQESQNSVQTSAVKESISTTLMSDLKRVKNGKYDRNNDLHIGNTSNYLVNKLSANAVENYMNPEKAYAAMVSEETAKEEGRYNPKLNYHDLGETGLYQALEAAENPVVAFAAEPDQNGNDRLDRIVLITDQMKNGNPVVVICEVNSVAHSNGSRVDANKTITVYDKENVRQGILKAYQEGRLLDIDKKRSQDLFAGAPGSNSLGVVRNLDFRDNIRNFWGNVKRKNSGSVYQVGKSENTTMREAFQQAEQNRQENTQDSVSRVDSDSEAEGYMDALAADETSAPKAPNTKKENKPTFATENFRKSIMALLMSTAVFVI